MTNFIELDRDFADVVDKLFSRHDPSPVEGLDEKLWEQLDELGLVLLTTPEHRGGSGATWFEAFTLHRLAAYHGVTLPLVERDLLDSWLAGQVGLEVDEGRVAQALRYRGALARSIQLCGALERCVDLAVEHASVRVQFGRPLMALQAVQALLADAAAEVALVRAATLAGVRALQASGGDLTDEARWAIAVAKSCTSHAAGPVTRGVHQVLGAIGTTEEHELHRHTASALAWRMEFGTATEWDRVLGEAARTGGLTRLWQGVVDGTQVKSTEAER